MQGMIMSPPTVTSLREAARLLAPRMDNYQHITPEWAERRLERRFREIFST
jgi:hypothetical protein